MIEVNYNEYKETIAENMKLIVENDRLKKLYETDKESWKEQMYELEKKYKIMKTNANQLAMKIDKAVEYIKNNQWYSVDYGDNILDAKEILDILKGDL